MKSLRPAMLLLLLVALLAGCADPDQNKPWIKKKPAWWESGMDPDDRAFYHDFLYGQ
jgi:hypothetical protein